MEKEIVLLFFTLFFGPPRLFRDEIRRKFVSLDSTELELFAKRVTMLIYQMGEQSPLQAPV